MRSRVVLLCSLLTIFAAGVVGQVSLSLDEYIRLYAEAQDKSRETVRRKQEVSEWYKAGRVTSSWIFVTETDEAGSTRWTHESREGGKISTSQTIEVGGVTYCRKGRLAWKLTDDCGPGFNAQTRGATVREEYTKENSVFEGQPVTILRSYTETDDTPNGKGTRSAYFTENRAWISKDGLILKREYVSGQKPARVDFRTKDSYDYKVKISPIKAPI